MPYTCSKAPVRLDTVQDEPTKVLSNQRRRTKSVVNAVSVPMMSGANP